MIEKMPCSVCGGKTYPYNTRFRPGTLVVTMEDYKCEICNRITPVKYKS